MMRTIPWFLATMLLILITFTMAGCSDDNNKTSSGGGQETDPATTTATGTEFTTTQSNEEALQEASPPPGPEAYAGVYDGTLMFNYTLNGMTGTRIDDLSIEILEDGTVLLPEGQKTQLNGNAINALLTPSDVFEDVPCDGQLVLHGIINGNLIDGTVDVAVDCPGADGEGNGTYHGIKVS